MAKKPKDEPEVELDPEVAEEVAEPVYGPDTHLCFEGAYVEHPEAAEKPRRVSYAGANFEHTHEDANGVWCYRRM